MASRLPKTYSFDVKVGHISANPVSVRLKADERELKLLADTWSVSSVIDFSAELAISRWKRDGVKVVGSVRAVVEQPCVVTLDPVRQTIEEPVHALFVPEGSKLARFDQGGDGEVIVDPDGPDLPETFAGDTIDVGAAAAEFAAMAIDHYPRKDGTVFAGHIESGSDTDGDDDDRPPSPFAVLKDWKRSKH
jgi:hypothetical protein